MQTQKRRMGDRRDGVWLRETDALHAFMPYLMPNRADNEAYIQEEIDITRLNDYLESKNSEVTDGFRYTIFHVLVAAFVKTLVLRPKMNRFIKGNRIYQRNEISIAFVMKKDFSDEGGEALIYIPFDEHTTVDTVRERIKHEIQTYRQNKLQDNSTDMMDTLIKMPRFALRFVVAVLNVLDYYGKVPYDLIKTDPNHASVFITNLGSIKLNAGYHHLNNWGTNSIFVVVGEKKLSPAYDEDGFSEMRETLKLGLVLDERIADGYYYSKTIKLLKTLLLNPELLEIPAMENVDYE